MQMFLIHFHNINFIHFHIVLYKFSLRVYVNYYYNRMLCMIFFFEKKEKINYKRNISDRQNFLVLNLVVLIIWHYKQFYESDEVTFKLVFQTYTITGH